MPRRILRGTVVKSANNKTVAVKVERRVAHPLLKKTVQRAKKYQAHDEENKFRVGDLVLIQESAPISKNKRWTVLN